MNQHTTAGPIGATHTPPLGYHFLTPFYDLAIAVLTREGTWRKALIEAIAPQSSDRILDIGSGTGSLAKALSKSAPDVIYTGIDPDEIAVRRARKKVANLHSDITFKIGYFSSEAHADFAPTKIVSSLVLHQVPLEGKLEILAEAYRALPAGGEIFIADYGLQTGIMSLLFRLTVQNLDGVADTQPNADGILPDLLGEASFADILEVRRIQTLTGSISIYRARKPDIAK